MKFALCIVTEYNLCNQKILALNRYGWVWSPGNVQCVVVKNKLTTGSA